LDRNALLQQILNRPVDQNKQKWINRIY
jgi:hypothetical protein